MVVSQSALSSDIGVKILDMGGNAAAFLCSDYASGITGEITYVDAGFNIAAMPLNEIEHD